MCQFDLQKRVMVSIQAIGNRYFIYVSVDHVISTEQRMTNLVLKKQVGS